MDLAHGARRREQTLAKGSSGASLHHDSCGRHFAARGFKCETRTTQRGTHEVPHAASRRRLMPHRSMSPLLRTPRRRPRRQSPRRPLAPSRSRPRPLASLGIPRTPFAFAAEGVGRSCTLGVTDANRQWPCRHANRVHVRTSTAPVSLLANAHQRREAASSLAIKPGRLAMRPRLRCFESHWRPVVLAEIPLHPKLVHLPLALAALLPLLTFGVLLAWWRGWLQQRT